MTCATRLAFAAILALAGQGAVRASVVCVTNQAELEQAAAQATVAPMTILIHTGVYNAPAAWYLQFNSVSHEPSGASPRPIQGGTDFLGGYGGPTCATRDLDGSKTIFNDSTLPGADTGAYVPNVGITGSVVFEGLSLRLKYGITISADNYFYEVPPSTQLLIRRVELTGSQFLDIVWAQDFPGGSVRVVNSQFHNNGTTYGCILLVDVNYGSPDVAFVNDTVIDNDPSYDSACMYNGDDGNGTVGAGAFYAHNNIFYGTAIHSHHDFSSNSSNLELIDNLFGSAYYPPQTTAPVGTLYGDPKLDAYQHPIESPPSPVINRGTAAVYGDLSKVDFAGNPRLVGSRPDLGAFESKVNDLTTQLVQNTNDHGTGSLRQAILNANGSSGFTAIKFHIGNDCATPKTIKLQAALPAITQSLSIEGFSQPGAKPNDQDIGDNAKVCIILEGTSLASADALRVPTGVPDSMHVQVSGIAFNGFPTGAAVRLSGGSAHVIAGNHLGGSVGGVSLVSPASAFVIGNGVHDVRIGSDAASDRNIIGYTGTGVLVLGGNGSNVDGAHHNHIRNNYFGVDGSFANIENNAALTIRGHDNIAAGNAIGYSQHEAINIDGANAHDNTITGNWIGTAPTGEFIPNQSAGIHISNGAHDNTLSANFINHNLTGVRIDSGLHNSVRANSIDDNYLGIDLAGAGVTDNNDDGATGALLLANRALNFPEISLASGTLHKGVVSGTLQTTEGTYIIDVYASANCSGTGNGEGARWLESTTVEVHPLAGVHMATVPFSVFFTQPAPGSMAFGTAITATATDDADNLSPNNTSEFSQCSTYVNDVIFANGFDG